jgi:signal transduction histidine kinase
VSPDDQPRIEQLLAGARMLLALVAMVAVYLDPSEPTQFAPAASTLLVTYAVFASAIAAASQWDATLVIGGRTIVHAVDVAVAALITLLTQGPSSPFYVFFVFVLMAAAVRWGTRRTLSTGVAVISAYILETVVLMRIAPAGFEVSRFLMRAAYLLAATIVFTWIGGRLTRFQAERDLLSRTLARITTGGRFATTFTDVVDECVRHIGARMAVIVLRTAGRTPVVWRVPAIGADVPTDVGEAATALADRVDAATPSDASVWHSGRVQGDTRRLRVLGADGRAEWASLPLAGPRQLLAAEGAADYRGVRVRLDEWDVCVLVFDAGTGRDDDLRLLQRLASPLGSALYAQYLTGRVRSRVGEVERARLARDLHDGLIQSLIGLEMELAALRRHPQAPTVASDLEAIQSRLHEAVLDTRDLMSRVKPLPGDKGNLTENLAALVERFRHDTGIDAQLVSTVEVLDCPSRTSRELLRVAQEALVNVRKHAEARHVVVRLSRSEHRWQMSIDDDGQGFPFSGRWTQAALDRDRRGPLVIKERVRAIDGELTIESEPGSGARLIVEWGSDLSIRSTPESGHQ